MINIIRSLFVFFIVIFFLFFNSLALAATENWQHPGVLVSRAQLDFITQQVNAKSQPIYQQFLNARNGQFGSKTYAMKGPWTGGIIQCGFYSKPDYGCSAENADASAAYVQALLWYITGDQTYANNAIAIMNAYSHKLKGFAGYSTGYPCPDSTGKQCANAPLQAAWDAEKWPRAAEIIRYGHNGSAGWAQADITAFSTMLKNVYQPLIYNGSRFNGNWELSMIDAMMGIAVFNEDLALLRHAQLFWSQRVPAYFYNYHLDNPLYPNTHAPFPSGRQGGTTWNGQTIFNSSTTGVSQETCRDLTHTEYGIASTIDAAETDYIQGGSLTANLYTANGAKERLITSLNLMAGLELAQSTTAPADVCTGAGNKISLGSGITYAIGYNHYHNRLKDSAMADASGTTGLLGTSNTYQWIHNKVLFSYGTSFMILYEALTHYANAPVAANFSLSSSPAIQTIEAGKSTSYKVSVTALNGYNKDVTLSLSNTLPAGITATLNPTVIKGGIGISTLTVNTAVSAPANKYILQINGTDSSLTNSDFATLNVIAPTSLIIITANDQKIIEGATIPPLTWTANPSLTLTTNPICTTLAKSASLPGTYQINCSGAAKQRYTFSYIPGSLTIAAAQASGKMQLSIAGTSDARCQSASDTLYVDGDTVGTAFTVSKGVMKTLTVGPHKIALASQSFALPVANLPGTCKSTLSASSLSIQANVTSPVVATYVYQDITSMSCKINSATINSQSSWGRPTLVNKFTISLTVNGFPSTGGNTALTGQLTMVNPFIQNFWGNFGLTSSYSGSIGKFTGNLYGTSFTLEGFTSNDISQSVGSNPLKSIQLNGVVCQ